MPPAVAPATALLEMKIDITSCYYRNMTGVATRRTYRRFRESAALIEIFIDC
jgi:hypothetical protein